ncbi:hypothetical protein [Massilia sp. METH4]|uniref:hypothetical protein n=1 Tax=Massilia sp. METH4 TaxID=3123041 RepID=UPI0030CC142E
MRASIRFAWALPIALWSSASFSQQGNPPIFSCATDRPAIVEGSNANVYAWFGSDPYIPERGAANQQITWTANVGKITRGSEVWDLSAVRAGSETVPTRALATASVQSAGKTYTCTVEVIVARKEADLPIRGEVKPAPLLPARRNLLPTQQEADGFGLYSYLLFATPPRDPESTARYLKAIEAYLSVFSDVDAFLSRHIAAKELNVTYMPLKSAYQEGASVEAMAKDILERYDYAAAQILLRKAGIEDSSGPFLISSLVPLRAGDAGARLQEDLSGVAPELIWFWLRSFHYLAAQERSWTEVNLRRFGLRLRNAIAVGGKVSPAVYDVLKTALQFKGK